jgi:uncharacterized BrkB/YihY/UPF0761 family membrane protein
VAPDPIAPDPAAPDPAASDPAASGPEHSTMQRAREVQERVVGQATDAYRRFERRRAFDHRVDTLLTTFERDRATGGVVLAGALAFRVFLFFIPYVAFIVILLGVSTGQGKSERDIARRAGVGGLVAKAAGGIHLSGWERLSALVVIGFGVVWAARTLYRVLRIVMALEWSIPIVRVSATRPALLLIAGTALLVLVEAALSRFRRASFAGGLVGGLIGSLLFLVLLATIWLLVLRYLPHPPDCPWWALAPGAAIITIGTEIVHLVTIYWIAHLISSKSEVYGALGAALALMFWAYLIGRVLVLSAVVNSTLWSGYVARMGRSGRPLG